MDRGYKCRDCGAVCEKPKDKTVNKIKFRVCPQCSGVVDPWERPLNDRAGYCQWCAGTKFDLAIVKGRLLRHCKTCDHVIDTDNNFVTVRKGKKEYEYKPN